jgi:proline iminopeptidase
VARQVRRADVPVEAPLKPRALFLHGGPGLNDYLSSLETELEPVFTITRYEQGKHLDVHAFVDEAIARLVEPTWLVGHSWGGRLAFHVAAAAPDRVLGIVAIGTLGAAGDGGWDATGPRMAERLTDEESALLESAPSEERLRIVWPAYFSSREATPPFPPDLRGDHAVLLAIHTWIVEHRDDTTLPDALRRLRQPVLILHGENDAIPLEAAEETAALCPRGELRVLVGVAHFPWLERPGAVRDEVAGFLRRSAA